MTSEALGKCYDYSKLMQMLACGGQYKGKQIMGRKKNI